MGLIIGGRGFLGIGARHPKKVRSPVAVSASASVDLLLGTGIFDSEADWGLLEAGLSVPGDGTLVIADTAGSGARAAFWQPSSNPLTASTDYNCTWTWTNACSTASGPFANLMGGSPVVLLTHTSGAADYSHTSGVGTTTIVQIRLHDTNSLTYPGNTPNGMNLQVFAA